MGRTAHPKDARRIKHALGLGFTEDQIRTACGIRYAWYRRCFNEETGLGHDEVEALEQLIASGKPAQRRLSLDAEEPIHIPGAVFDLNIRKKSETVWMVEIRTKTGIAGPPNIIITDGD